jgi:hypothetical protein
LAIILSGVSSVSGRAGAVFAVLAAIACKGPPAGGAPSATGPGLAESSVAALDGAAVTPGSPLAPALAPDPDAEPLAARAADASSAGDAAGARAGGAGPRLLDPGQPPRRALRYAWHLDQREQLSMDMRTAASTGADGTSRRDGNTGEVSLPSVHVVIAIDPQSVDDDGDMRYLWRVTSATVGSDEGTPSQVTEGMRAEVTAIGDLSGNAVVTERGLAKEVVAAPGGATGQMADQVRQTLRDVAAPLPEEEVGIGARWRKVSRLDERDARVAQTETFRLVDLEGDRGTLDDALAQTAPPQTLRATGQAPPAHTHMESMLASGEARVRFDLSRLVPQTAFEGTTTMVLSGQPSDDGARSMRMVMRVFIGIAGSRR